VLFNPKYSDNQAVLLLKKEFSDFGMKTLTWLRWDLLINWRSFVITGTASGVFMGQ